MQAQAGQGRRADLPDAPTSIPAFDAKFRATLTDRQARTEALLASYTDTSDAAGQKLLQRAQVAVRVRVGQERRAHPRRDAGEAQADPRPAQGRRVVRDARAAGLDRHAERRRRVARSVASTPGEFVPAFQTAADAAPFDTPIGPVHSQFGYHVILVTHATLELRGRSRRRCCSARPAGPGRGAGRDRRAAEGVQGAPRSAVRHVGPHPERAGPERLRGDAAEGADAEHAAARARRPPRPRPLPVAVPGASPGTP